MEDDPEGALSEAQVERLRDPRAHPGDPGAHEKLECIQTHLSWVFLSRERVYKFRKAVDFGFVCFLTRRERDQDCLRELALNRRLAPDVYLGVAPLLGSGNTARLGTVAETLATGNGRSFEHCVVMRRLPEGRDALSLLEASQLDSAQLDRLARRIAGFHAANGLGRPAPWSAEAWRAHLAAPVEANFDALDAGPGVEPALLDRARQRARDFLWRHADRFERRRLEGHAVDGHGDLHLQHIWFETGDAEPIVIDCVEFNEGLRRLDAASEVAFTAMDLRYRGAQRLAERFLAEYARASGDHGLYTVVDFFLAYRAGVRAKVAALAAGEPELGPDQRRRAAESAARHLALAADALEPRPPGTLIILAGVIGTGKSSVAERVAQRFGGVAIASDRLRKQRAGLAATDRRGVGVGKGIYSPQHTRATYDALLEAGRAVLESGRLAILDATFAARAERDRARALAAELGIGALCIETRCADEPLRRRLARRARAGDDPSDAGPSLLAASRARFEAIREWPSLDRLELATDAAGWEERLDAWLRSSLRGTSPQ